MTRSTNNAMVSRRIGTNERLTGRSLIRHVRAENDQIEARNTLVLVLSLVVDLVGFSGDR